jgi:hypothetical protein
MYYVTAGLETEKHSRYWVRGFSCKSKDHARFICSHIIAICSRVQPGWIPRRGTQLSLVSTDSRVSAATTASGHSESSGASAESARTAISGLSAGQEGLPPTAAGLQVPQGPPMSVSQHTLDVQEQQQRQPFGNSSMLQNRMKADLGAARGALKGVNRGRNGECTRGLSTCERSNRVFFFNATTLYCHTLSNTSTSCVGLAVGSICVEVLLHPVT